MKQLFFGIKLTALIFLLLSCFTVPVFAESDEDPFTESIPEEYTDFLETVPEEILELLPDGLFSSNSEDVGNAVSEISDFSYLLQTVLSLVGFSLGDCVKLFAFLAGLLLISSVCRTVQTSLHRESVARAFSFCSTLIITVALLSKGYESIQSVSNYFSTLNTITAASIPLTGALYAIGGNLSAAAGSTASLSVFMTVLEELVGKSIVPFCSICLAFALVGSLDPSLRIGTLSSTLKKNYTTALSFFMMLLLAMLSAQTVLGAHSDTLAMRSVKFATGNMIPVVGGSISELLRSVSAGIGYLRGTVGICALLLLLLFLLPTLIELFLVRFTWQLSASLADLLGCDSEKKLLEEFASINGYLIAAIAICSSVLILSFTLLLNCVSAIG
ncbi:MAG: hypothetical protein IJW92_08160 [Clostridia bacterium]|nr:hypothetical protein [Clostridia bacterium]